MNPVAGHRRCWTHVAVRDGRILGVGTLAELRPGARTRWTRRFADQVLMPGLVEGHSHLMAGTLWRYTYCGFFDVHATRRPACGRARRRSTRWWRRWPRTAGAPRGAGHRLGLRPDLLRRAALQPRRPGPRQHHTAGGRDARQRPHPERQHRRAAAPRGCCARASTTAAIPLGDDGLPTGELKGPEAMMPALALVGLDRSFLSGDEAGIHAFGRLAVRAGVTTATDLAATLGDDEVDTLLRVTGERRRYPVRLVPLLRMIGMTPARRWRARWRCAAAAPTRCAWAASRSWPTGRSRASRRGCAGRATSTARPTGCGTPRPRPCATPTTRRCAQGVQVHTHTNGDEATELALDCIEAGAGPRRAPTTASRCSTASWPTDAQFRRMKALGLGVNLFANHHFYWGDQHAPSPWAPSAPNA
jgi:predicted amidohydrolase YtcJ